MLFYNSIMAIPEFQDFMLPVLTFLKDGNEHSSQELYELAAIHFGLTEDDKREGLPTGSDPKYLNRTSWARTFLIKAGLVESPRRGYARITAEGQKVLDSKPTRIDNGFLSRYPAFREFRYPKKEIGSVQETAISVNDKTPEEQIELGMESLEKELRITLLDELLKSDPFYFEQIVGDLLRGLGYGDTTVTKRSNDNGIDAIVNEDKLGLDRILVQAKRYSRQNTVPIKEIRDFVGTLDLNGVTKGIFITTSTFPKNVNDVLKPTSKSIVLINGEELSKLMISNHIGVNVEKEFSIKRIDSEYFNPL